MNLHERALVEFFVGARRRERFLDALEKLEAAKGLHG
jgi:hypothetical protein